MPLVSSKLMLRTIQKWRFVCLYVYINRFYVYIFMFFLLFRFVCLDVYIILHSLVYRVMSCYQLKLIIFLCLSHISFCLFNLFHSLGCCWMLSTWLILSQSSSRSLSMYICTSIYQGILVAWYIYICTKGFYFTSSNM